MITKIPFFTLNIFPFLFDIQVMYVLEVSTTIPLIQNVWSK